MAQPSEPRSLRFKEWMSGHVVFDHLDDLIVVNDDGTGWARLALEMNMHISDVDEFWRGNHIGDLGGTVVCDALGGRLPIHEGHFQLMVPSPDGTHDHMNYLIQFEDTKGRRLTLHGYKEVAPGDFGPWEETTTTLCRIEHDWVTAIDRWDPDAPASGVLRIRLWDFIHQEFTFRASPDASIAVRLHTRATFAGKFVASLWHWYRPGHPRRRPGPAE
ncbi:MAG TPA: hypothetical protein VN636_19460 [Acidimicrobiia bacterium]|nr:hypothetical protein [Acidimicrobiia bacterium]